MINIHELTIAEFHRALQQGETSCVELVALYLQRMHFLQPTLKWAITINDSGAMYRAKELDTKLKSFDHKLSLPPLFGVPIVLKDTYLTSDMPTSAGSVSLKSLTSTDAVVVTRLRAAGAILLAKTNLHEFSLHGITLSSLGGQAVNPYDITRTPGGSSGGTGIALATNMALVGCGGDTMNSIRSPASACSIVGLRPTAGQIPRTGVVPVALTQDAIGPLARTVQDVRRLFDVMRGEDSRDSITVNEARDQEQDDTVKTRMLRIGVVDNYFNQNEDSREVNAVMERLLEVLNPIADIKHLTKPEWDIKTLVNDLDVQAFELRAHMDEFLQSPEIKSTPHRTLESIRDSGEFDPQAMTQKFYETMQEEFTLTSREYHPRLEKIKSLKEDVKAVFSDDDFDVLVYPHQRQLVAKIGVLIQPERNGILASLTGRPSICLPAGFSEPSKEAPLGVPIGVEILGKPWRDHELIDIGERVEILLNGRLEPLLSSTLNIT